MLFRIDGRGEGIARNGTQAMKLEAWPEGRPSGHHILLTVDNPADPLPLCKTPPHLSAPPGIGRPHDQGQFLTHDTTF